jgi:microcystin-dependent protein
MADAFTGEIRLLPYTFPPVDWAWCTGDQMSIQQYTALYSIIGTRYGGDAQRTFNLPEMRGTVPIGMGNGPGLTPRTLTKVVVGAQTVPIYTNQTANHTHTVTTKFQAGGIAGAMANLTDRPAADSWLSRGGQSIGATNYAVANYVPSGTLDTTFPAQTITPGGGVASPTAHENRQPFLPINFCICLNGAYPINP